MPHFPTPLFPAQITSKAMEALNGFIVVHGHDVEPIVSGHLEPLRLRLTEMVDCFFPENGDQEEFSGADTIDGNDYIHPIKVAELAAAIGREMGLPRSRLIELATAAALMNLGYVALRRTLLDVRRPLTAEERYEHVRPHCAGSVTQLADAGLASDVLEAIGQHHERWDGSGYPEGLSGEAISEDARIIGVADAFVSLRSYRPYRATASVEKALEAISLDSGTAFEPRAAEVLQAVVEKYRTRFEAPVAVEAGRRALPRELESPAVAPPVEFSERRSPAYTADAPAAVPTQQHITVIRRAPPMAMPPAPSPVPGQPGQPGQREPALRRPRRRRRGRSSMFGARAYVDELTRSS